LDPRWRKKKEVGENFVTTRYIFFDVCPYTENEMGWTFSTLFAKHLLVNFSQEIETGVA